MLDYFAIHLQHPVLLIILALAWLPVLLWLARWFFGDFESFLEETGFSERDGIWSVLLGFGQVGGSFWLKVIGCFGAYAILVGLSYHTIAALLYG